MKFLMIANSFGVNLQSYANLLAEANGFDLDIYVLYIGSCTLETHCRNIDTNEKAYELFHNGTSTKQMVSILEALEMEKWDAISLQQASHKCGYISSYYPYFAKVYEFAKAHCGDAKIYFHKTWAYSSINTFKYDNVPSFDPAFDFKNAIDMKKALDQCADKIMHDFKLDGLINSGDVVELAMKEIGDVYDFQGFHMNQLGCYLIGANLVKYFSGKPLEVSPKGDSCLGNLTRSRAIEFINKNF